MYFIYLFFFIHLHNKDLLVKVILFSLVYFSYKVQGCTEHQDILAKTFQNHCNKHLSFPKIVLTKNMKVG